MSKAPNVVVLEGSQLFPWNQPFFSSCLRWAGNREGCGPAEQQHFYTAAAGMTR